MAKLMAVGLVALVLSISLVNAEVDCGSVLAGIFPCSSYLSNFLPITPGVQCCNGASALVSSSADTNSLCKCFTANPFAPAYLPSKAQQLPNFCNLTSFLPLVSCLVPSSSVVPGMLPVPPMFPIPPVFPLPPTP